MTQKLGINPVVHTDPAQNVYRGDADHGDTHAGNGVVPLALTRKQDNERIFAQFLDPVYRLLYSRVGNREDAEDLTSHVFLKASQQLDSRRNEASVASWLFTVARTVLADHWRSYYRSAAPLHLNEALLDASPHEMTPTQSGDKSERVVSAVLAALPARYRQVLELRFLQGCSIEEAAREMNVSVGNLKVLQHRALAKAAAGGTEILGQRR